MRPDEGEQQCRTTRTHHGGDGGVRLAAFTAARVRAVHEVSHPLQQRLVSRHQRAPGGIGAAGFDFREAAGEFDGTAHAAGDLVAAAFAFTANDAGQPRRGGMEEQHSLQRPLGEVPGVVRALDVRQFVRRDCAEARLAQVIQLAERHENRRLGGADAARRVDLRGLEQGDGGRDPERGGHRTKPARPGAADRPRALAKPADDVQAVRQPDPPCASTGHPRQRHPAQPRRPGAGRGDRDQQRHHGHRHQRRHGDGVAHGRPRRAEQSQRHARPRRNQATDPQGVHHPEADGRQGIAITRHEECPCGGG